MLTVEEAAERLRMGAAGVRRLIRVGQIQAVRVGRRYLIAQSEVARILTEGTAPIALAGGRTFRRVDSGEGRE